MPFLAVDEVKGYFEANGVVGLAPIDYNIVDWLFNQGQIDKRVVGLNL